MDVIWILAAVSTVAVLSNVYAFRCMSKIDESRSSQNAKDSDRLAKLLRIAFDASMAVNGAQMDRMKMQLDSDFKEARIETMAAAMAMKESNVQFQNNTAQTAEDYVDPDFIERNLEPDDFDMVAGPHGGLNDNHN